jgi:hypothetical protein
MRKVLFYLIFVVLLSFGFQSCSSESTEPEATEEVEDDELEDDELEDDEFEDDEFEDDEFEDDELEDEEYEEEEPEVITKPAPTKPAVAKTAVTKVKPAAPVVKKSIKTAAKTTVKTAGTAKPKASTTQVVFQPSNGGWLVKDGQGSGFVVSFKDEDVHPMPSVNELNGNILHKGKSDWRIPTFDEATYLIDAMPLRSLTAEQKEFWTATSKKNGMYVFGLNKTYRLADSRDSCGLLLVREL